MSADQYGNYYWQLRFRDLQTKKDHTMQLYADEIRVEGGMLFFLQKKGEKPPVPTFIVPVNNVIFVFAASLIDGHAVSMYTWHCYDFKGKCTEEICPPE